MRVEPLEPRRIRHPRGAYGWVDLRVATDGHLAGLGSQAALVYLFLCTVGNRDGISFWSRIRMAKVLSLTPAEVENAMPALIAANLIAANNRVVQVLPLPDARRDRGAAQPNGGMESREIIQPATQLKPVDPVVTEEQARAHEPQARARIARFYGTREPSPEVVRALARALALRESS